VNKHLTGALILLATTASSLAGEWTLTTTPNYVTNSAGIDYTPVNKTVAKSGVLFTLSITTTYGSITSMHWGFTNGMPKTSTSQTPNVKYGSTAYGNKNAYTFAFHHLGSGSSGVCSIPPYTGYVNVIKPYLQFNMSSWSTDPNDPLNGSAFVAGLNFATSGPTFNKAQSFTLLGGTRGGTPYEYKVTATPSHSGAKSSDFSILEQPTRFVTIWNGNKLVGIDIPAHPDQHYKFGDNNVATIDQGTTPTNPVLYAFDAPNLPDSDAISYMHDSSGTSLVISTVLTSTPCYQVATNPADTTLQESHTFVLTGTTDGTGKVHWF
jgi:hypothetical protein